jgi:hypothetical protein
VSPNGRRMLPRRELWLLVGLTLGGCCLKRVCMYLCTIRSIYVSKSIGDGARVCNLGNIGENMSLQPMYLSREEVVGKHHW